MRCDEVLAALETGGPMRRRAARRHAARCVPCARAVAGWLALRQGLAEAPPLTDRHEQLWIAAIEPVGESPPRPAWRVAAVALAACALLAAGYWLLGGRERPRPDGPLPAPPVANRIEVDPIEVRSVVAALTPLERRLDQVEQELAALSRRAELSDARRETEKLLDTYRHW